MALPVKAAHSNDVDYHAIFEKRNELSDSEIEEYYADLSTLFDANADGFITALSQENYKTLREVSFYPAVEHQGENAGKAYQTELQSRLQAGKDVETVAMLKNGVLILTVATSDLETTIFGQECYQGVQDAYHDYNQSFLLFAAQFRNSEPILNRIAESLSNNLTANELQALNDRLSADAVAEWSDEEIEATIGTIQAHIANKLNAIPQTGDIVHSNCCAMISVVLVSAVALLLLLRNRRKIPCF